MAVTAEWLVDSIDGVTQGGAISQQWVGLILLPIVGNAAGVNTSFSCRTAFLIQRQSM